MASGATATTTDADAAGATRDPDEFDLSAQLALHGCPVRVVVARDDRTILSAGTKEEFIEWKLQESELSSLISGDAPTSSSAASASSSSAVDSDGDALMDQIKEVREAMAAIEDETKGRRQWSGRMIFNGGTVMHPLTFCLLEYRSLTSLSPDLGQCYWSGGNDNRAILWNSEGHVLSELTGHSGAVNSIDMFSDQVSDNHTGVVVTGSYDGSAKVWNKEGVCTATLTGHKYGVEVCCLETGEVVTGSHESLHFWNLDGTKIRDIGKAHDHVIRKIKRHPLGFVTCANDGFVKVWSNQGEQLQSICAHPEDGDRPSFIYGLHFDHVSGFLMSTGEDGTCRLWSPDGVLVQSLLHPGAVWSVDTMPNGDIVTACADCTVRIWTRIVDNLGDPAMVAEYYSIMEAQLRSQMESGGSGMPVDESELEPMTVLKSPGKPGEFKMVKDPEKGPSVYQWDSMTAQWTYIGQITGRPGGSGGGSSASSTIAAGRGTKAKLDGKEYDHVVHIDLSTYGDGTRGSVPLGFNVDDDPEMIAKVWCELKSVDLDMVPQIVAHLKPLADPSARKLRLQREAEERAKRIKHLPSYIICNYEINGKMNLDAMRKNIEQSNAELMSEGNPFAIGLEDTKSAMDDSEDVEMDEKLAEESEGETLYGISHSICKMSAKKQSDTMKVLWTIMSDQRSWHVDEFSDDCCDIIVNKMLRWPKSSQILGVVDMIRVLMLHNDACDKLMSNQICRQRILEIIERFSDDSNEDEYNPNISLVLCRLISNYLAKRKRDMSERKGSKYPRSLLSFLVESLSGLSSAASVKSKKSIQTAYLMLAHNSLLWLSKFRLSECDLYLIVCSALFDLPIGKSMKPRTVYYISSIVGTIAVSSDTAKLEILEIYDSNIRDLCELADQSGDPATMEIGTDVRRVFGLI